MLCVSVNGFVVIFSLMRASLIVNIQDLIFLDCSSLIPTMSLPKSYEISNNVLNNKIVTLVAATWIGQKLVYGELEDIELEDIEQAILDLPIGTSPLSEPCELGQWISGHD